MTQFNVIALLQSPTLPPEFKEVVVDVRVIGAFVHPEVIWFPAASLMVKSGSGLFPYFPVKQSCIWGGNAPVVTH
jgi:hypothetical protein